MIIAAAAPKALWYLTRGSGIVALLMLSVVALLGIMTSMNWKPRRVPAFVVQSIHRNVSLAAVLFIVIHIATTVLDGYVAIGWLDAIVPFRSGYKPLWVGLGALAVDLMIVVTVTSLTKNFIGQTMWRLLHWLAYACWPVAMIHAIGIGSDSRQLWMLGMYAGQLLVVGALVFARGISPRTKVQPAPVMPVDVMKRRAS